LATKIVLNADENTENVAAFVAGQAAAKAATPFARGARWLKKSVLGSPSEEARVKTKVKEGINDLFRSDGKRKK
jgi:hypothetical protein